MKKLSSINWVSFKEDKLYLEETPIFLDTIIENWLNEYNDLDYIIETAEYNENRQYINFLEYPCITLSIYNKVIERITIYPYGFQSSPYYKGDIFIGNKKLEVPFKSDDIEKYFPAIDIKPKGYFKRFSPRETLDYNVSDKLKIEISMGRDPELVSSISLKHNL